MKCNRIYNILVSYNIYFVYILLDSDKKVLYSTFVNKIIKHSPYLFRRYQTRQTIIYLYIYKITLQKQECYVGKEMLILNNKFLGKKLYKNKLSFRCLLNYTKKCALNSYYLCFKLGYRKDQFYSHCYFFKIFFSFN